VIVVTGAGGFIGSAVVWLLNKRGETNILAVDIDEYSDRYKNLVNLQYTDYSGRDVFLERIEKGRFDDIVDGVIHMGACSDTTERDKDYLMSNNYEYTKRLAIWALEQKKRFIYASSAATYGDGREGFSDDHSLLHKYKPLNLYGESKHCFDIWALENGFLDKIAGLKYFNVFGPNEYHKGNMRSMVHKSFCQIKETGVVKLFKSNNSDHKDGGQVRDFIYVKDAVTMTLFVYDNMRIQGVINIGTGIARSFNDLVSAVFRAIDKEITIDYIEMPEGLRSHYQSYTRAEMSKLRGFGYQEIISTLEDGITDYVRNYLLASDQYLK